MFTSLECYWWPSSFAKHTMEDSKNETHARRCVPAICLSCLCTALNLRLAKSHDLIAGLTISGPISCSHKLQLISHASLKSQTTKNFGLQGLFQGCQPPTSPNIENWWGRDDRDVIMHGTWHHLWPKTREKDVVVVLVFVWPQTKHRNYET